MDADFSRQPKYLPEMLRLTEGHDLVLGSRWVRGGGTANWPWTRRLLSRGGSLYARAWLGVGIHEIEVTYRAVKSGFSVVETPSSSSSAWRVRPRCRAASSSKAMLKVPRLRWGAVRDLANPRDAGDSRSHGPR